MLIRPLEDLQKLLRAVRHQGIRRTTELIIEAIADRLDGRFDQLHGVETARYVRLATLGFTSEDLRLSGDYSASPVRTFRSLLSLLPSDLTSFTLVDLGSGKGRALLVASEFPFRHIVGVEFSRELHRIAEENLKSYRGHKQRCTSVSSICMRAEEFSIPDGDLVLYFYNPFEPEVMERVLRNVTVACREHPRTIYLVFLRMRFRPVVERCGVFHEIPFRRLPFDPARPPGCDAAIFVSTT